MGTVMAIMGAYFLLNGQAGKALVEVNEWLKKELPDSENIKEPK